MERGITNTGKGAAQNYHDLIIYHRISGKTPKKKKPICNNIGIQGFSWESSG